MKRFTGIAIAGIAALGLTGCKQNPQQERQDLQETRAEAMQDVQDAEKQAQESIAEEQRSSAENIQEERQDVAETRQEAQQEIAEAEKDVAEADRDQAENWREDQGVGGTGQDKQTVKSQTYTGTVTDAGDDDFKLRDQAGKELEFKFADNAAITLNGKEVDRKVLHEGAEVRANADLRDGEWYVKSLEVLSSPKQDEQKK